MNENKKPNFLCIISLLLTLSPVITILVLRLGLAILNLLGVDSKVTDSTWFSMIMLGVVLVVVLLVQAGLVVMIYVRVKFPKNVFGKVLMWLYIVGWIVSFSVAIYELIACKNELVRWVSLCH